MLKKLPMLKSPSVGKISATKIFVALQHSCARSAAQLLLGACLLTTAVASANEATAIADATKGIKRLSDGTNALKKQKTTLETQGRMLESVISDATAEYRQMESQITALQSSIARNNDELSRIKKEKDKTSFDRRRERDLENSISAARNSVSRVSQQLRLADQRIRGLRLEYAKLEKSYATLQTSIAKDANDYWQYIDLLGRRSKSENEAILATLDSVLAENGDNDGAYLARGTTHWRLGNVGAAMVDLDRIVNSKSDARWLGMALRGLFRQVSGDERNGLKDLGQATQGTQGNPRVHLVRALSYCLQEKFPSALIELEKGQRLRGEDRDAACLLALVYGATPSNIRHPMKAAVNAQRACDVTNSEDWLSLYSLAAAHSAAKNFKDAATVIEQAEAATWDEPQKFCAAAAAEVAAERALQLDWKKLVLFRKGQ